MELKTPFSTIHFPIGNSPCPESKGCCRSFIGSLRGKCISALIIKGVLSSQSSKVAGTWISPQASQYTEPTADSSIVTGI